MNRPVMLTVSGRIPPNLDDEVAAGVRPRADYRVLGEVLDADVVDVEAAVQASPRLGGLLLRLGGAGLLLGWHCFRRRRSYEVIVTDGEQVGLPLALLGRIFGRGSARHVMITHIMSTSTKSRLVRGARLAPLVDKYVVYCSWQQHYLVDRLGVAPERVMLSTFMVDTSFFDPAVVEPGDDLDPPTICSAGLERRDYETLVDAVAGLDVRLVIAAASPWSRRSDSSAAIALPANVEIRRLSLAELRDLYARSRFAVMPLEPVEFQAGITTILEAMSMGLAVVCTRTPGQTDTVREGETGCYVEPGDVDGLRSAIESRLTETSSTRRLGVAARRWVVEHADIEAYALRLKHEVDALR